MAPSPQSPFQLSALAFLFVMLFSACTSQQQSSAESEPEMRPLPFPEQDTNWRFKGHIRSFFEDSQGRFWIGSHKEGLARLEGQQYSYFTTEHGLPDMQVRSIQEDPEGYIWVGTQHGVARYNGQHFTKAFPAAKTWLITDYPWAKGKPITDYLFFDAGNRNGFHVLDQGQLHYLRFPVPEGYPTFDENGYHPEFGYDRYATYGFHKDEEGNLYLGTSYAGLFRFDGQELTNLSLGDSIGVVRSIFRDAAETIWFGNNGIGLFKYENEELVDFSGERGLKAHGIKGAFGIEQDEKGNIWFGTYTAGLWSYAPAKDLRPHAELLPGSEALHQVTEINGTSMMEMAGIYKDRSGYLWFFNQHGNVFRLQDGHFIELEEFRKSR